MKTPETRQEVHSFHVKRRLLDPPYDPYEERPRTAPRSLLTTMEDAAKAAQRAEREEAAASRWRTREKRQQEDRAGERATSACKRARQEAVYLLYSPSGFRPMPGAGDPTRPKRKPLRGGARVAPSSLARVSEDQVGAGVFWRVFACACVTS